LLDFFLAKCARERSTQSNFAARFFSGPFPPFAFRLLPSAFSPVPVSLCSLFFSQSAQGSEARKEISLRDFLAAHFRLLPSAFSPVPVSLCSIFFSQSAQGSEARKEISLRDFSSGPFSPFAFRLQPFALRL
jgi:hypothetical protein